jgi:hypothetical protein
MGPGLCLDEEKVEQVDSIQVQLPASPASLIDMLAGVTLDQFFMFDYLIKVLILAYRQLTV